MPQCMHDKALKFRAARGLVEQVRQEAERQHMTVSEYLRHAVRERIAGNGSGGERAEA